MAAVEGSSEGKHIVTSSMLMQPYESCTCLLAILLSVRLLTAIPSVLNTVGETTKGLPIVGEVTDPLLKTVGGVTDGLPIVCNKLMCAFVASWI
jgi:hypothetical protein